MSSYGSSPEPGWYYADGDPAGTHRYWDGAQWQGGPQPIGGGVAYGYAPTNLAGVPAARGDRFVAFLIDALLAMGAMVIPMVIGAVFIAVNEGLGIALMIIGFLAGIGFVLYNQLFLQGTTGQTLGKRQRNISLLVDATGAPPGILMMLARLFLSGLIDQVCSIDTIWILIDDEHRRLSDKVLKFHVRQGSPYRKGGGNSSGQPSVY